MKKMGKTWKDRFEWGHFQAQVYDTLGEVKSLWKVFEGKIGGTF